VTIWFSHRVSMVVTVFITGTFSVTHLVSITVSVIGRET
jgi:hypothetical protein